MTGRRGGPGRPAGRPGRCRRHRRHRGGTLRQACGAETAGGRLRDFRAWWAFRSAGRKSRRSAPGRAARQAAFVGLSVAVLLAGCWMVLTEWRGSAILTMHRRGKPRKSGFFRKGGRETGPLSFVRVAGRLRAAHAVSLRGALPPWGGRGVGFCLAAAAVCLFAARRPLCQKTGCRCREKSPLDKKRA